MVYQELLKSKLFGNGTDASELVHEWSTKKAESMLMMAVNQQKDIIFDGARSAAMPFIAQAAS